VGRALSREPSLGPNTRGSVNVHLNIYTKVVSPSVRLLEVRPTSCLSVFL
jgi:hypothetical protein